MIHVVFQPADALAIKKAFELDPSMEGPVVEIRDDFAVGPIKDMDTPAGIEARKAWWRAVLAGGDYNGTVDDGSVPDDNATVAALIENLNTNPQEVLWIWAAQNKHDVSGYFWLMSQLREFQGRIYILYLNNLPFINEKGGIFYPVWLFEIPPREFVKAKRLARLITPGEFEIDPDEWNKLAHEDKPVRILEGGKKLAQHDVSFYDDELRKFVTADWIKGHKLIHQVLTKGKHSTGDAFLLWRLKEMIAANKFEVQGEVKNMKDFELRIPDPA